MVLPREIHLYVKSLFLPFHGLNGLRQGPLMWVRA